jgi:hypothetical protein
MRPDVPLMILEVAAVVSIVGAAYARGKLGVALALAALASFTAEAVIRGEQRDWPLTGIYAVCAALLASALGARAWQRLRGRDENGPAAN